LAEIEKRIIANADRRKEKQEGNRESRRKKAKEKVVSDLAFRLFPFAFFLLN